MAQAKRSSIVLETARHRMAGLKSINPAPDFGEGLTVALYEEEINAFSAGLDAYNQAISTLNDKRNAVDTAEANLREKNRRMLRATEAKYGPNSSEFEQAGGTRTSQRQPRRRKVKGTPPTP